MRTLSGLATLSSSGPAAAADARSTMIVSIAEARRM